MPDPNVGGGPLAPRGTLTRGHQLPGGVQGHAGEAGSRVGQDSRVKKRSYNTPAVHRQLPQSVTSLQSQLPVHTHQLFTASYQSTHSYQSTQTPAVHSQLPVPSPSYQSTHTCCSQSVTSPHTPPVHSQLPVHTH